MPERNQPIQYPDRLACATPDVIPVMAAVLGALALLTGLVAWVALHA